MKPALKKENGFTLLELLLVIGIAGLLLVSSIFIYRSVTEANKATQATRLLMTIRQQAGIAAHQQNAVYTGIVFDSTAGAGAADGGNSPLVTDGTLYLNQKDPFNGTITVAPSGAADENLSISFDSISQAGCVHLMVAINATSEIVSVGTATATYTSAAGQIPVTADKASAACNLTYNKITWILP